MNQVSPRLVLTGGCLLAFGASFLNTGFLLHTGASVSHLTGDIARLASNVLHDESEYRRNLFNVAMATLGFVIGATTSGFFLHHPRLEMEKPYGRIISSIGALLLIAHFLFIPLPYLSICLAGYACGLQNALATKYRGMVLRTTHLTGLFTDFGVSLGMLLRGHRIEIWRVLAPIALSIAFFAGALVSTLNTLTFNKPWLLVCGLSYVSGGALWSLYKRAILRPKLRAASSDNSTP